MNEEPSIYREPGFQRMEKQFLTNEEYARAIETFIVTCADTIITDKTAKCVYLAKRRSKPLRDMWWMIGGRRQPGVPAREAMQTIFKRETLLELPSERFVFVALAEYLLKDREQEPQNKNQHTQGYTFAVDLTAKEREVVAAHLDSKEYYIDLGLRAFGIQQLEDDAYHPTLIALATRALYI